MHTCVVFNRIPHTYTHERARGAQAHKTTTKTATKTSSKKTIQTTTKEKAKKDQKVPPPSPNPQHPASAKQQQQHQQQQQQQQQSKQTRPDTSTTKEPKGKRIKQSAADPNQPVCFRATLRPCNTVYLGDGSPDTMSPSATLKQGLLVNVAASPSTGVPTPGQPVADRPLFLRRLATRPLECCKESPGFELCPSCVQGGRFNHRVMETVQAADRLDFTHLSDR